MLAGSDCRPCNLAKCATLKTSTSDMIHGRVRRFAAICKGGLEGPHPVNLTTHVWQVTHSEEEWARLLTPAQYSVLRQANTERSFSSPLYTVCA